MGIANEDLSTGTQNTLAEHWDGTSWVIQPTLPPGGSNALSLIHIFKAHILEQLGSAQQRFAVIRAGSGPAGEPV